VLAALLPKYSILHFPRFILAAFDDGLVLIRKPQAELIRSSYPFHCTIGMMMIFIGSMSDDLLVCFLVVLPTTSDILNN